MGSTEGQGRCCSREQPEADGKGKERHTWGKGKGSEGQGPSPGGQASNLSKRDAEGNRKQLGRRPVAEDVCHKCKGTGHWPRECPQNKNTKGGQLGSAKRQRS